MHGGTYLGTLDKDSTTILVVPKADGEKYDHARLWGIPCVRPDWVYDSIERGYCLSTSDYRVESAKASTPTKDESATGLLQVGITETSKCTLFFNGLIKLFEMLHEDEIITVVKFREYCKLKVLCNGV